MVAVRVARVRRAGGCVVVGVRGRGGVEGGVGVAVRAMMEAASWEPRAEARERGRVVVAGGPWKAV